MNYIKRRMNYIAYINPHSLPYPISYIIGFVGAIGNTPLLHLPKLSKETGCNIYGKAEWMNPGGSVKDRYL